MAPPSTLDRNGARYTPGPRGSMPDMGAGAAAAIDPAAGGARWSRGGNRSGWEESVSDLTGEMDSDEGEDRPEPMSEREALAAVQREIDSAIGWTGTRLAEARRKNMNEYFGNSRGDERIGRSQVTTRDTFEQVEWLLPPLMEIFTGGNEVCRFEPQNAEDDDGAKQATDGGNHIFRKEHGFMVLETALKDAAIQKNGIVKVWWDDSYEATVETYEDKTLEEVAMLDEDPDFELREATAKIPDETGAYTEVEEGQDYSQADPQMLRFDITGVRGNNEGHVKLENIAPEEFLINRDCKGLHDKTCRFIGHRIRTSESELVSWGFDPEVVKRLPGSQSVYNADQDAIIRASQDDSHPLVYSYRQDSQRTIYINDVYILLDVDQDGVSEWWNIKAAGEYGQEMLSMEPCDGHPFASGTFIPIPHRFYGLAIADVVSDLYNVNTTLWRQFLDSNYLANDPQWAVLSQGGIGEAATPMVNLEQLHESVPGGWVEEYAPGAIRPLERTNNSADMLAAMEHHEKRLQQRTGISPEAQGIDPASISKHVFGAMMQSTAAQQRIMHYARIMAETLVTDIFKLIYKTLLQHDYKTYSVRLRGEWVDVDPASWKNDYDCKISVGLGHGSKMERVNNLQTMAQVLQTLGESGYGFMVAPDNVFNLTAELTEALGFMDVDKFVTDPSSEQGQQLMQAAGEEEDPQEEALKLQQEVEAMRLEVEAQKIAADLKKTELDHEAKILKIRVDARVAGVDIDTPMDDPSLNIVPPPPPQLPPNGTNMRTPNGSV